MVTNKLLHVGENSWGSYFTGMDEYSPEFWLFSWLEMVVRMRPR